MQGGPLVSVGGFCGILEVLVIVPIDICIVCQIDTPFFIETGREISWPHFDCALIVPPFTANFDCCSISIMHIRTMVCVSQLGPKYLFVST